MANLVLFICAAITNSCSDLCSSLVSLPRTSFQDFKPSLFHRYFQRGIFGEGNGDDAMEKNIGMLHINQKRRKFAILSILSDFDGLGYKKVVFKRKKCLVFSQSKG